MAMVNTRTKRINQSDHGGNTMPRYTCPVKIRGVLYNSQKEAADALGVNPSTIYKALQAGRIDDVGMHQNNRKKPITIRGVHYDSQTAAAKAFGTTQSMVSRAVKLGWINNIGLGRNASTKKPIIVDGVKYQSITSAARAIGAPSDSLCGVIAKRRKRGIHKLKYKNHNIVIPELKGQDDE